MSCKVARKCAPESSPFQGSDAEDLGNVSLMANDL